MDPTQGQSSWPAYLPARILVKTALGEAPEHIPTSLDVRRGLREPAARIDGGPLDRILRHFSEGVRVSRVHVPARCNGRQEYDDIEHVTGVSRTFRVDCEPGCHVSEVLDSIRQVQAVETASACYLCTVEPCGDEQAEPDLASAWGPRDAVHLREALAMEPGDPAVTVAVVDTGVAGEHPELWRQLGHGFDTVQLTARDLGSGLELLGDATEPDRTPDDEVGHGTACVGIIAAGGQRIPPGLGGQCRVMPVRVLASAQVPGRDHPVGMGSIADIDAGIKRAVDLGAKVINLSLGTPVGSMLPNDPIPHTDVICYGLARGCVFVAASGNSGKQEEYTPACLPDVIAVGSVGLDGAPSAFTTSGPHVDLCACGENVASAGLTGYSSQSGTSFAAPFVTGAAALLISRALRHSLPLDASAVRRLLVESARRGSRFHSTGYGAGILDAHAALNAFDQWVTRRQRQRHYEAVVT